ncbi:MAG: hypothetical protein R6X19_01350 [Kiritimatiellia bacterium]
MKAEFSTMLSGIGFHKLSVRRRKQLWTLLLISLGIHLVALLIFGGVVVMRALREEKTVFVAPAPLKTYEPRKLEHKVKVQKQQRSASRPAMMPRMVAAKPSDFALPEIKSNPKLVKTTFQPKFKEITGTGLGVGLGTGYGVGGFGMGVSSFNFFGIRGRGDKIAILVDVSVSMVEEGSGGVVGYERVKRRIEQVLDALSDSAIFNVIVFADAANAMEKQLVIASKANKNKAKEFIRPYNKEGNWGLTTGNIQPPEIGLKPAGGTTRLDLALAAAFEQGADTILIISDGIPRVEKMLTEQDYKKQEAVRAQWMEQNKARVEEWDEENAGAAAEQRVWIPATPARPPSKTPPKEGQAPDKGAPAREGHWEFRRTGSRPHPPEPEPSWWTLSDFIEQFTLLHETYYMKKGKKLPVVHCIGYQINEEGGDFLKAFARQYKGQYRRVTQVE